MYARGGVGPFQNCSILGDATIDAYYWNECLPEICSHGRDAKCAVYQRFADICDAVLPEGQKLDQTGSAWRKAYTCPAPFFVAGTPNKDLMREAESAPVLEKKPLWDLEGDF
ncbi:hypothetical protein AAVH_06104 [Aphelenchoides avenae]|nr:hypothetical protein AAVH_06104 [Aphelenchus avenae]